MLSYLYVFYTKELGRACNFPSDANCYSLLSGFGIKNALFHFTENRPNFLTKKVFGIAPAAFQRD
jgi:hypothetical protein